MFVKNTSLCNQLQQIFVVKRLHPHGILLYQCGGLFIFWVILYMFCKCYGLVDAMGKY